MTLHFCVMKNCKFLGPNLGTFMLKKGHPIKTNLNLRNC